MASSSQSDAQNAETATQSATPTEAAQEKGPYDDLLCTICNLKACWMTPEAAGKSGTGEQAQATG